MILTTEVFDVWFRDIAAAKELARQIRELS